MGPALKALTARRKRQTCQQAVPTRWQGSWPSRRVRPSTLGPQHKASPALPAGCLKLCLEGRVDLELSGQVHRWMNEGRATRWREECVQRPRGPRAFGSAQLAYITYGVTARKARKAGGRDRQQPGIPPRMSWDLFPSKQPA